MIQNITLKLADGGSKEFTFKAAGTTAIRYKQLFGEELLGAITSILTSGGNDKLGALMKATQRATAEGKTELGLEDLDPESTEALISIVGSGKMDAIGKLAFVMNKQAEGAKISELSFDDYFDWLDQFDGAELLIHSMDFIGLYLGQRITTSKEKKDTALLTGQ